MLQYLKIKEENQECSVDISCGGSPLIRITKQVERKKAQEMWSVIQKKTVNICFISI